MSACDALWDILASVADGTASASESVVVSAHIAVCSECSSALTFLVQSRELLSNIPEVEPPAYLRRAILAVTVGRPSPAQALRAYFAGRPALPRVFALGAAAALLCVAIPAIRFDNTTEIASNSPKPTSPVQQPKQEREFAAAVLGPPTPIRTETVTETGDGRGEAADQSPIIVAALRTAPELSRATRTAAGSSPGVALRRRVRIARTGPALSERPFEEPMLPMFDPPMTIGPADVPRTLVAGPISPPEALPQPMPAVAGKSDFHIVLAADSGISPGAVTSLADLRRDLRKEMEFGRGRYAGLDRSDRRAMMVSLIKTRF